MSSNEKEYRRKADYHLQTGNEYAEESHQWEGDLGECYSALAEAHQAISQAFERKANELAQKQRKGAV